jgi:hypothetical protein
MPTETASLDERLASIVGAEHWAEELEALATFCPGAEIEVSIHEIPDGPPDLATRSSSGNG